MEPSREGRDIFSETFRDVDLLRFSKVGALSGLRVTFQGLELKLRSVS